jgi:hypothetical protein
VGASGLQRLGAGLNVLDPRRIRVNLLLIGYIEAARGRQRRSVNEVQIQDGRHALRGR